MAVGIVAAVSACRSCRRLVPSVKIPFVHLSDDDAACRLLSASAMSSFFRETSGRSLRRRRRARQQRTTPRHRLRAANVAADDVELFDHRTVRDILFPEPKYDDGSAVPPQHRIRWPKSFGEWRDALTGAWSDYRSTWRGFLTSRGFLVEDPDEKMQNQQDRQTRRDEALRSIKDTARKNVDLLRSEAESLRARTREITGINSKDDLKRWVGNVLQLFTDCVKEFMVGYRKGRDDEVEKMLTEYFQELEKSSAATVDRPKRRKRKRRVINSL